MPGFERNRRLLEILVGALLFAVFLAFYLALAQTNLTFDGAAFLAFYSKSPFPIHRFQPLFSYVIWSFVSIGRSLGIDAVFAGDFQAAFFTSLSVALFYALLRRYSIGISVSALFAIFLGLSDTSLE